MLNNCMEKVLGVTNHQEDANKSYRRCHFRPVSMAAIKVMDSEEACAEPSKGKLSTLERKQSGASLRVKHRTALPTSSLASG